MEALRAKALGWLSRREYTREALRTRLLANGADSTSVSALVEQLETEGLLSDQRAAEALVHVLSRRYGPERVRFELRRRGVSEALSREAMAPFNAEEMNRARQVLLRRFPVPATSPEEHARRFRFLRQRGFSAEVVRALLKQPEEQ